MIEEIVEAFLPFRQSLMDYAPIVPEKAVIDNSNHNHQTSSIDDSDRDTTFSPSPTSRHQTRSSSRVTRATKPRTNGSARPDEPSLPAGHIQCPICQAHIHQDKADHHVNRCLEGKSSPHPQANHGDGQDKSHYFDEPPPPSRSATPTNKAGTGPSMTRLPKMSYAAMTDAKLRKTMIDMGINSSGSRAQLQRRCTEFIAMWNSNLDSKRPKSKKELWNDLKAWDRVQAKPIVKITDEEIDSAHQSGKFDSNFQDLIAQAKESMRKRKAVQTEEAGEGKRDENQHVDKKQQTENV
ncbi:putative DNA repair protein [Taphrina deformans PYCC 5710]|uniref:DNA repair protein n=1 Tax=Taphrina deformans (strain PYCC 5710 / ATCC 11124 / CBS 356.35 / IMI 108563 / JCM 9778 / NBRC 8474) TaxID=1097556 RepID=R4XAU8_TAPDE|nr:putative DNA repair protein [Taphrina deformans PYCC 5710]|eukprot:CCG82669.1 putative DNA repair protein [Taphrina deformans PYCC 5710]